MKPEVPPIVDEALSTMKGIPAPDPARQLAARQTFLAEARRMRLAKATPERGRSLFNKEQWIMNPLVRALMALIIVSGGTVGTVAAADASLPGDALYSVDQSMEQVQKTLATSTQAQARLNLRLASERAEEIVALAEEGVEPSEEVLDGLEAQLDETLNAAAQIEDDTELVEVLEDLDDLAEEAADDLEEVDLPEAAQLMARVRTQAREGMNDTAGFRAESHAGAGWEVVETPEPTDEPVVDPTEEPTDDEALADDLEPTAEPTDEVGPQQDQTRDQLQDGSCDGDGDGDGTGDCEPIQDQTHDQTRDQLQDGSCDGDGDGYGDGDCVPNEDGEQHQGPPEDHGQGGNSGGGGGGRGGK